MTTVERTFFKRGQSPAQVKLVAVGWRLGSRANVQAETIKQFNETLEGNGLSALLIPSR
jgi:hypothetical protein